MSQTRILCEKCKTPMIYCKCERLKPCPFCGNTNIYDSRTWQNEGQKKYFGEAVGCADCEVFFDTASEWNRRATYNNKQR
jgi:hypothetical protein